MVGLLKNVDLNDFFAKIIRNLPTQHRETGTYIEGIYKKYVSETPNILNKSITLEFIAAKFEYSFIKYQNLGDCLFFLFTIFPGFLNAASPEYYTAIAQNSYYKCYRLLNGQWPLFEDMADNFKIYTAHVSLKNLSNPF